MLAQPVDNATTISSAMAAQRKQAEVVWERTSMVFNPSR